MITRDEIKDVIEDVARSSLLTLRMVAKDPSCKYTVEELKNQLSKAIEKQIDLDRKNVDPMPLLIDNRDLFS